MAATARRILLVDDDKSVLEMMADFLRSEGYHVDTAPTAESGLDAIPRVSPDLVILDINMPGMGGVGFLKRAAAQRTIAAIPVLVCTARANTENYFQDLGVAGFVAKPCEPTDLLAEIERILAAQRTAAASAAPFVPRRVLIVDDDADHRAALARGFRDAGFTPSSCGSAAEGVERAIVEKPDAILMRLVMEGMNGDRAAQTLGDIPSTRGVPVILYDETGSVPRDGVLREHGPGVRRFVKTQRTADLVAAVRALSRG